MNKNINVITLCGSTRFKNEFLEITQKLTLKGNVVLFPVMFSHADNIDIKESQKEILDRVHMKKIDMADEVIIINKDGYIGESTRKEIEYAMKMNKKVYYLYNYPLDEKYELSLYRRYILTSEYYDTDK